ncbi:sugar ABC transporter substrate-binding protein [Ancylobacter sp. G4_0304]|uniref:sugar ABC transporter substrate-binding protein n=1 Tax=Ancylobacter sp. G4_0304 TaxID=3114289 RepID=UPI0039C67023
MGIAVPAAIAQDKPLDRTVSVKQYREMYGKEPVGKWVLRSGENLDWWKPRASKKYHLALVVPHVRDPYWVAVAYGAAQAAKELGVTMDLRPAGGYARLDQMTADIEDLIARRVDGMVVAAVDYSAVAVPIKKAWDAGIFTTSALIPTSYAEAPGVSVDDYETGVIQAQLAAQKLAPDAKIFMLNGPPGVEWSKNRAQGFKDTLAKLAPKMTILGERYHEMDRTIAQQLTEDALQTWPDMSLVFCTADFQCKGAISALKAAGKKPGQIGVTGVHMDAESIALLKEGWFAWGLSEGAALEGKYATYMLVHLLEGEKVPKQMLVPIQAYTPENIKNFEDSLVGIDLFPPEFKADSELVK